MAGLVDRVDAVAGSSLLYGAVEGVEEAVGSWSEALSLLRIPRLRMDSKGT